MKQWVFKIVLGILILAGLYWLIIILYIDPAYGNRNPLHPGLITLQQFSINPGRDTLIRGKEGTLIRIERNSFNDCSGKPLKGKVTIFLSEFYTPGDIVLSGLTTTSNGDILETGGMIWLTVRQDKWPVCINEKHQLGIIIPGHNYRKNMKYYTGKVNQTNKKINWIRPAGLLNDTVISFEQTKKWDREKISLSRAVKKGIVTTDTIVLGHDNKFYNDYLNGVFDPFLPEDIKNYVFETRNPGWINIDRLIGQSDTRQISVIVRLRNKQLLNKVFVKLILPDKGVYLQAYRLDDGRYIFGTNFTEKVNLPLGAKGYLLATTYYRHKPFYSLTEFKIQNDQTFNIELKETTSESLKKLIEQKF